jgi:phosphatidylinositol glycan class Q protein
MFCLQFESSPPLLRHVADSKLHFVNGDKSTVRWTFVFHNAVWTQLLDAALGLLLFIALWSFPTAAFDIATFIFKLPFDFEMLRSYTLWLMGAPAGAKLNPFVSGFFGSFVLTVVRLWENTFSALPLYLTGIGSEGAAAWDAAIVITVRIVAFSGLMGGFTMSCAVMRDLWNLATLHIYWTYQLISFIYFIQTSSLGSLFHLFQGKKANVLRKRIDSYDYDLDQLLLGTMLFTILVFLFPTTALYYFFALLLYLIVLSVHAVLVRLLRGSNTPPIS